MDDKSMIFEKLKECGFYVFDDNNIPMVILEAKNEREIAKKSKELKKFIEEHGYNGSFGWKARLVDEN